MVQNKKRTNLDSWQLLNKKTQTLNGQTKEKT